MCDLAAMRSDRQGPYDAATKICSGRSADTSSGLQNCRHTVEEARILHASTRVALDRLRLGVVVLDHAGRVRVANAAAEAAAGAGEPLQFRRGCFSARSPQVARSIDALTRSALHEHAPAGMLRVPRAGGGSWTLWITRLPAHTAISPGSEPGVLVTIADAHRATGLSGRSLVALYGLTRAEAELALALGRGDTDGSSGSAPGQNLHRTHADAFHFAKNRRAPANRSCSDALQPAGRTARIQLRPEKTVAVNVIAAVAMGVIGRDDPTRYPSFRGARRSR